MNALEAIKQNAKVQALIAKAIEEADAELTKLEQEWGEELQAIEKVKEQYLEAVKRFADASDAIGEIKEQLQLAIIRNIAKGRGMQFSTTDAPD